MVRSSGGVEQAEMSRFLVDSLKKKKKKKRSCLVKGESLATSIDSYPIKRTLALPPRLKKHGLSLNSLRTSLRGGVVQCHALGPLPLGR